MNFCAFALLALFAASVGAELYCSKPNAPVYGYISAGHKRNYRVGKVVIIKCNRGYQLIGHSSLKCLSRGNYAYWNKKVPVCKKIIVRVCKTLADPIYGDVQLTGVRVGAKATYTCNQGFKLKGNAVRHCRRNGQWSGSQPVCKRVVVTCPKLFDPRNGDVSLSGLTVGSSAKYSCNRGFQLRGNRVRQCQSNRQWSGSNPICIKIITCNKLTDPRYGDVQLNGVQVGSKATYSCDKGFKLRGNQVRKCQSNGQWSGSDPVCIRIITCNKLFDPRNGDVDLNGVTVGSRAKYSCDQGFELKGNRVRTCQSNGQWSGNDPICKKIIITCGKLIDPENGDVQLSGIQVGSRATYSCDRGFELKGNQVRTCQSNGQWSGNDPFCKKIIITCGKLIDPENGDVQLSGVQVGSRATYSCDRGFELKGNRVRTCQSNGQWSGNDPFCKKIIITCSKLIDPENGDVQLSGVQVGSRATYSCDKGFELKGNQVRTCQSNGQWSGNDPFCKKIVVIVQCPLLPKIKNGQVYVTGLDAGSQAHYFCDYGYTLKGTSPLKCLFNGYWSSQLPVCVYKYDHDDDFYDNDDDYKD